MYKPSPPDLQDNRFGPALGYAAIIEIHSMSLSVLYDVIKVAYLTINFSVLLCRPREFGMINDARILNLEPLR